MSVADIYQRQVVTIDSQAEVTAAAKLMREKHVGYLVVTAPGTCEGVRCPVGVLTDRDLVVSVMAREANMHELRVEDVMTRNPVVTRTDEPVVVALRTMRGIGVRRLPVVGSHGELLGVLALDDIIESFVAQLQDVAASVRSEQAVERAMRT